MANGLEPFPLTANHIRPSGRIFLSKERSKLCFELLEMLSAAQNNLPLQGQKTSSEVGVLI